MSDVLACENPVRITSHDRKRNVQCPRCKHSFEVLAGRKTNHGYENARKLAEFFNTSTRYEATLEPKSNQRRGSGVGVRPDIKVQRKDARAGSGYIYIERQEQNTTGTGQEKIANKIHKANLALRNLQVTKYYIVLAGRRRDLLWKVARDTFDNNGAYRHERLVVINEEELKAIAEAGKL